MTSVRMRLVALSAVMAALAVAAPVSGARAAIDPGGVAQGGQANGPAACIGANAASGVGDAGATVNQICGVAGAFVAPTTGQLATEVGPTIVGSVVAAPVTVSTGPVVTSSLP